MMTHPLPIAGMLPIKTLVARQLPTNCIITLIFIKVHKFVWALPLSVKCIINTQILDYYLVDRCESLTAAEWWSISWWSLLISSLRDSKHDCRLLMVLKGIRIMKVEHYSKITQSM